MDAARTRWLLAALALLALALRLWGLADVPPGVDADEAAIAYNAYSIARTGRDEHGALLPLALASFGDYKRPAYVYASVPVVALLGPTALSVRLPAALFGALSVPALYAVGYLLLRDRRRALIAAGLLAISPWHLQFTRAAREVSLLVLAMLVMLAALLAALRWSRGQTVWLLSATVCFLVTLYTYHSALVLAPLLAIVFLGAHWDRALALRRGAVAAAAVVLVAGALPLGLQLADGRARTRFDQASLLNEPAVRALSESRLARERAAGGPWLLQTPIAVAARRAVDNYLSHFGPAFLFTRGDAEWRHHASDTAQLYLWDAPLLLAGVSLLVRRRRRPPMRALGGWLLVAPLPAAFAENAPHAIRAIGLLPALMLLAGLGAPPLWRWLRARGFHKDWLLLLGLSAGFYLYSYYRVYPVERARAWNAGMVEGYRAAHALADGADDAYRRIVITEEMGLSYVYALFATGYDPARYLAQGGTRLSLPPGADPGRPRIVFAPFEVRAVDWATEARDPEALYVLDGPARPPAGAEAVHVQRGPDGAPVLQLVRFPG